MSLLSSVVGLVEVSILASASPSPFSLPFEVSSLEVDTGGEVGDGGLGGGIGLREGGAFGWSPSASASLASVSASTFIICDGVSCGEMESLTSGMVWISSSGGFTNSGLACRFLMASSHAWRHWQRNKKKKKKKKKKIKFFNFNSFKVTEKKLFYKKERNKKTNELNYTFIYLD